MPTKKPRVQTILNEDIYEKFKTLCDKEMRTESKIKGYSRTRQKKHKPNGKYNNRKLYQKF